MLDQCLRTKHKWRFQINRLEEQSLEMVRLGVKKQTEYNEKVAAMGKTSSAVPSQSDREADNAHHLPERELSTDIAARTSEAAPCPLTS